MKALSRLFFGLCLFGLLPACGGPQAGNVPAHLQGVQYPDWVLKGSGAFGGDAGNVFYGVSSVSGVRNHALARTTAENRARSEIGKIFEVYSAS